MIIEIRIDAAEKERGGRLIFFVDADRRVQRNQRNVDLGLVQRASPRVVMHARAAKHPCAARGNDRQMHVSLFSLRSLSEFAIQ